MCLRNMYNIQLIIAFVCLSVPQWRCQTTPQTQIVLDQGPLIGLKAFPDAARSAVYVFLGIPYAQPPVGQLRFASPRPHSGWNWTLQAKSLKPICPQLTNTMYDETADGKLARPAEMSEDCLYLNIWVPEAGLRYGNLPVLVIITGEDMAYDWPHNRANGLDFAAEGVVVVTIQYRQNIYGWISVEHAELPGNYGLHDQHMALMWIQHNIHSFGGNPNQVTLLGHGTTGAPCAMAHLINRQRNQSDATTQLFARLVLMSGGGMINALSSNEDVLETSKALIRKLGCQFEMRGNQLAACLRVKSVSDLQNAFESVYDFGNGNSTQRLGPIMSVQLKELLNNNNDNRKYRFLSQLPPIMVGITSNEGAFFQDYWLDLTREGYQALRAYINSTLVPHIIRQIHTRVVDDSTINAQIMDLLNWQYFSGEAATSIEHLLDAMQRLISEFFYEIPFLRILEFLSSNSSVTHRPSDITNSPLYAYIFDTNNALDMRGKLNLFGGASHSSDLPFLLGPSLFQQISRRRFTSADEKLCRKMRSTLVNFIKSGNPTPGRIYDGWLPYNSEQNFIYNLGDPLSKDTTVASAQSDFRRNLPEIQKLLENNHNVGLQRPNRNDYNNPYQQAGGQAYVEGRRNSETVNYLASNQLDSGYALHLAHVNGFWEVILPRLLDSADFSGDMNDPLSQRVRYLEASADAARYRHGFFAMLGLVALLLVILGLCVYLLRTPNTSTRFCL